jgi:hypothetical protein
MLRTWDFIATQRLVWMNGPFKAGTSDKKIFPKQGLMAKLASLGKKGIGDKGYSGKRYRHVMSTPNAFDTYGVKKFKSRALKRHENFNGMTKRFKCLDTRFRHGVSEFKYYFESICVICQYQIENGMPLYDFLSKQSWTSKQVSLVVGVRCVGLCSFSANLL